MTSFTSGSGTWNQLGFALQFDAAAGAAGAATMAHGVLDIGKAVDALTLAEKKNAEVVAKKFTPSVQEAFDVMSEYSAASEKVAKSSKSIYDDVWDDAGAFIAEKNAAAAAARALDDVAEAGKKVNKVTEERFKKGVSTYFSRAAAYAGETAGGALMDRFGSSGAGADTTSAIKAIVPQLKEAAVLLGTVAVSVGAVAAAFAAVWHAAIGMQEAIQGARMASIDYAENMEAVAVSAAEIQQKTGESADDVGSMLRVFGELKYSRDDMVRLGESIVEVGRALSLPITEAAKMNELFMNTWRLGETGARAVAGAIRIVADRTKASVGDIEGFLRTMEPFTLRVGVDRGADAGKKATEMAAAVAGAFKNMGLDLGQAGSMLAKILDPSSPEGNRVLGLLTSKLNRDFAQVRDRIMGGDLTDIVEGFGKVAEEVRGANASTLGAMLGVQDTFMLTAKLHADEMKNFRGLWKSVTEKEEEVLKKRADAARDTFEHQWKESLNKIGGFLAEWGRPMVVALTKIAHALGETLSYKSPGLADFEREATLGQKYGNLSKGFDWGSGDTSVDDLLRIGGMVFGSHSNRHLAAGGIVMPSPGGSRVTVAEAGQPELVMPITKLDELFKRHTEALVAAMREQTAALVRALADARQTPALAYAGAPDPRAGRRDAMRRFGY